MFDVFEMADQVLPSFEDSQRMMLPLMPFKGKVTKPLLLPEHTVAVPVAIPPNEGGITVIVATEE